MTFRDLLINKLSPNVKQWQKVNQLQSNLQPKHHVIAIYTISEWPFMSTWVQLCPLYTWFAFRWASGPPIATVQLQISVSFVFPIWTYALANIKMWSVQLTINICTRSRFMFEWICNHYIRAYNVLQLDIHETASDHCSYRDQANVVIRSTNLVACNLAISYMR